MTDKVKEIIEANPNVVLNQVKDILKEFADFPLIPDPSGSGFLGRSENISKQQGILSVSVQLTPDNQLMVVLGIVKAVSDPDVPLKSILQQVSQLGEKVWLLQGDKEMYEVAFKVEASPLNYTRMEKLHQKVKEIVVLAKFLQESIVHPEEDHVKLTKKYEPVNSFLKPVFPINGELKPGDEIEQKARKVWNLLNAGVCVAISSEQKLPADFFLALLSKQLFDRGQTLGYYTSNALPARGVLDILAKAPGWVTIPSMSISFGTNVYDRASELDVLMATLANNSTPVLFTGKYAEHQTVFGSGQGHQSDPLQPAIVHLNPGEVSPETLIGYALHYYLNHPSVTTKARQLQVTAMVMDLFHSGELTTANMDVLPSLIKGMVSDSNKKPEEILSVLTAQKETFRGLNIRNKQPRHKTIQQWFFQAMQSGEFPKFLQQKLVGQDKALKIATQRLWTEFLTRPAKQPVRMLLQGIPGVGKSEFSQCVAEFFGIPHVSIDTASLQSHQEASSLLLGSGRGLVQSYLPGKLETMAKHHDGCVAEVADLDHCQPSVRGFVADLFLHIMENGYAQTATGETISCASLILMFTINLPGGKDETVLKGLGFNSDISEEEILGRTQKEIKSLFSGAFASRVGNPVIFKPFSTDEKVGIMEMALKKSLRISMQNIQPKPIEIALLPGAGVSLLPKIEALDQGLGARGIYDLARELVTTMVSKNFEVLRQFNENQLKVKINKNNELIIQI
jgi:hypothetical protein